MRVRQITVGVALSGLLGVPAHAEARDTPKVIRIAGTIDADTDLLDRADHVTDGYATRRYPAPHAPRTRDLTAGVGWAPTLHTKIHSVEVADREVARGAGAGRTP